jgi:hypothetical protein
MESELQLLAGILVATLVIIYGLVPLVVHVRDFGHKKIVRCPKRGRLAEIELEAPRVTASSRAGRSPRTVKTCSLWPDMGKCSQACMT